jgi:hypothetical protein
MRGLSSQGFRSRRGAATAVVLALLALLSVTAPSALAASGSISGTITGAPSHDSLAGVEACVVRTVNEGEVPIEVKERCRLTDADGDYEIGPLDAGTYLVSAWPPDDGENYLPRYYDADGMWPTDSVTVADAPLTGIDMELPEGGTLSGRVTEELGGKPLAGVLVCAGHGWEENEPVCVPTDADGTYEIVALSTDIYTVRFSPAYSGLHYFEERYHDEIVGSGYPQTPVQVTAGSVTSDIDAALTPSAEIRGRVTLAANRSPLNDILVCAAPPSSFSGYDFDDEAHCSRTNTAGTYAIQNLEGGQYKVLFSLELREYIHYFPPLEPEEDGYPTRFWNEKESLFESDVLTLVAPTLATGIDARLGSPPPGSNASPSPLATPVTQRVLKRKCRHGKVLRKVKGKRRCVRRHRQKHRR